MHQNIENLYVALSKSIWTPLRAVSKYIEGLDENLEFG